MRHWGHEFKSTRHGNMKWTQMIGFIEPQTKLTFNICIFNKHLILELFQIYRKVVEILERVRIYLTPVSPVGDI